MDLHIIYTKEKVLCSKKKYNSWREIQVEYDDYVASLGFWSANQVEKFLEQEYTNLKPSAKTQIANFITSDLKIVEITYDYG